MRQLDRERRGVWSASYLGKTEVLDEDGYRTGEFRITYSDPVQFFPTVSPRRGNVLADGFGTNVDCERTLVSDDLNCPVDDTSVLWVDVRPELDREGHLVLNADMEPTVPWDYTVSMVSRSYNFVNVAMKKVQQ